MTHSVLFSNRAEAGRALAERLVAYQGRSDLIVLGIPRGGVSVALEVAAALHAPLEVFVVRKLGVPGQEELAFGAISSGGVRVLNNELVEALGIPERDIETVTKEERNELERRERAYRGTKPPLNVAGMTAILVDDGIATGSSMQAAIMALRHLHPARIVVAVPVAPVTTCDRLRRIADEVVCAYMPASFLAVGEFYEDFLPVGDEEVTGYLTRTRQSVARKAG
jgi:putative phosphoribosyl transferase